MQRGIWALVAVLSFLPLPGISLDAEAAQACHKPTEEILQRLEVAPKDIKEISVVPRRESHRSGWVVKGYDAWVRLQSCGGALILDFTRHCRERQVYTRGDCKLAGVKSF